MARGEKENHQRAGREAGVERHAASHQWRAGDVRRGWKPISVQLKEEAEARRGLLAESARADASKQLQDEAILVRSVRVASGALFKVAATLLPGMIAAAQKLSEDLKSGALTGDPERAGRVIARFSNSVVRLGDLADHAQVMERRMLGEPNEVLRVEHELIDATPEAAEAKAHEVLEVAARLKQLQASDQKEEPGDGAKLLN